MSRFRSAPQRGFTLVEMLVVLGIIAILVALLMPAVMYAVNRARRTRQSLEVSQLASAIEAYKQKMGDYPPNFRDYNAVLRHVQRCYPKIAPAHLAEFVTVVWPGYTVASPPPAGTMPLVDEGESLVFWLAGTRNDPRYPFGPLISTGSANSPFQRYYEFDERRWVDEDGDKLPSYRAVYAKESFYVYLEARSYDEFVNYPVATSPAFAERRALGEVRPFWSELPGSNPASTDNRLRFKPMKDTSFQILCAGQDGDFGTVLTTDVKFFPGGGNCSSADKDNLANFSDGKVLEDHIP